MKLRIARTAAALISAGAGLVAGALPAGAMHASPAPVGEVAPEWSGHYTKPDIGSFGAARPWEAGPAWNR